MQAQDPCELVLRHEDDAEAWAVLAELPAEWGAILIAKAAAMEPAEIQQALGLTDRQYRKRIQKANRHLAA